MQILYFVETTAETPVTDEIGLKAVASLRKALRGSGDARSDEELLGYWTMQMIFAGLQRKTRLMYFRNLHSKFLAWRGEGGEPDPFENVRAIVNLEVDKCPTLVGERLKQLPRVLGVRSSSPLWLPVQLFLYLFYNPALSLLDVWGLKFGADSPAIAQQREIADAMRSSARRQYVFPLGQGKMREPMAVRELSQLMQSALGELGLQFPEGFSRESITSLWIAAALRCRMSVAEIVALVPSLPAEYSFLQLITPAELSPAQRLDALQRVADTVNDKSERWFVMKLRKGQTLETIQGAVELADPELAPKISYYYPVHEVVQRDRHNRRIVTLEPYLPGILFFRVRHDFVAPLFAKIGALAWCYRWANRPDSPYCTISSREMRRFQHHIGQFTPDIRMELVTRPAALAPGQQVLITGGGVMEGQLGIIQSVRNLDGTRTYSLRLSENDFAQWTVTDIEETFLEPCEG